MVHGHPDFAQALRQGLAVLAADEAGDLVTPPLQFRRNAPQELAPRLRGERAPGRERRVGVRDGLCQPGAVDGGDFRKGLAAGRVDNIPGWLAGNKLAVEVDRKSTR